MILECQTIFHLDLGFPGYFLLYASTLYNIDENKVLNWKLSEKDQKLLKKVIFLYKNYLVTN